MEKVVKEGKPMLTGLIKIQRVVIDNPIFRLHYRATGLLLLLFTIMVTGTQFFGDPIMCIQKDDIPVKLLNTYCWIEGTYTLPKAFDKKVGEEVVYPGVDKRLPEDEVKEHAYYQWVCFMLMLQAALFYLPRFLWKSSEKGRLSNLLMELNNPVLPFKDRKSKKERLVNYFLCCARHHHVYAYTYAFCELLNFVNVLGQIYFVDKFLGGEFTTFGARVVEFTETPQEFRVDPMIQVFPRMTKCTFHKFGSSGDVQKHDALCLLPLNIVNEKIYVILWFWFVILAVLTGLLILYRILVIFMMPLRFYLLRNLNRLVKDRVFQIIMSRTSYGDWFLLYLLGENMEHPYFKELVEDLADALEGHLDNEDEDENYSKKKDSTEV